MRLWSIHPKYLDSKGLVALWRESLLAKKVLLGETKGYKNHPQLIRFRETPNSIDVMHYYLSNIWNEAHSRGYHFNREKFNPPLKIDKIPVSKGQVQYELTHLQNKLFIRDKEKYNLNLLLDDIVLNSSFYLVDGGIEEWERLK